jgi:C-terminal processing protease CtpA/Prc
VLYDGGTASSGEATAISFRGRANTRSFGSPTGGRSTANSTFTLSDGVRLLLTTATMVDRAGTRYGSKVVPDEPITATTPFSPGAIDEVVTAATRWLAQQPMCTNT